MRTDDEMLSLILGFAEEDERIRAVYMNGSRTNPHVEPDCFQDFDIVYVVTETQPYIEDTAWISRFGDIAVMQEPDAGVLFEEDKPDWPGDWTKKYTFLMQFTDGNRIDLTFQSVSFARQVYGEDKLTRPLLDKDGILPPIPPPDDVDYRVKCPTEAQFRYCCNEFWWVSPYIAKGLARHEILYAMDHFDSCARPMLLLMLSWYVAIPQDFSISVGKSYKYLPSLLPDDIRSLLLATYPPAEEVAMWQALYAMCALFNRVAAQVGEKRGFTYHIQEAEKTTAYIKDVEKRIL